MSPKFGLISLAAVVVTFSAASCSAWKKADEDKDKDKTAKESPTSDPKGDAAGPESTVGPNGSTPHMRLKAKLDLTDVQALALGQAQPSLALTDAASSDAGLYAVKADGSIAPVEIAEAEAGQATEPGPADVPAPPQNGVPQNADGSPAADPGTPVASAPAEPGRAPTPPPPPPGHAKITRLIDSRLYMLIVSDTSYVPEQVDAAGHRVYCILTLLAKADGRLYCVPNILPSLEDNRSATEGKAFQWDAKGSLIIFQGMPFVPPTENAAPQSAGYPFIYMLDLRSPDNLIVRTIFDKNGYSEHYRINASGDVFMQFYDNSSDRQLRIVKPEGGFQPFGSGDYLSCLTVGAGAQSDSFYFIEGVAGADYRMKRIYKDGADYKVETVVENGDPTSMGFFRCSFAMTTPDGQMYFVGVGDRPPYDSHAYLIRYKAGDAQPTRYTLPDAMTPVMAVENNGKAFILGKDTLGSSLVLAMNETDWSFSKVIDKNLYQISSINAAGDGIAFQGERLKDGAVISAGLNAASQVSETTVGMQKVTALIPIH